MLASHIRYFSLCSCDFKLRLFFDGRELDKQRVRSRTCTETWKGLTARLAAFVKALTASARIAEGVLLLVDALGAMFTAAELGYPKCY